MSIVTKVINGSATTQIQIFKNFYPLAEKCFQVAKAVSNHKVYEFIRLSVISKTKIQ